jgi:hypothetical protein
MDYCACGSVQIFGVCSNRRCPLANNEHTEWIIDGELVRFSAPVTLEEAERICGGKAGGAKIRRYGKKKK